MARAIRGNDAPSGVISDSFQYLTGDKEDFYLLSDGMDLDASIHVRELSGTMNNGEPREINIYQVPDVELIWKGVNDENKQISFWKTQQISGYFNPGVIAVKGHSSPGIGFLLKANPRSAVAHFKLPESYDLVLQGSDLGQVRKTLESH